MARLNDPTDSDDELPELSIVLGHQTDAIIGTRAKTPKQKHGSMPCYEKKLSNSQNGDSLTESHTIASRIVIQECSDKPQPRKQRPLEHPKLVHVNPLLLPMSDASSKSENHQSKDKAKSKSIRASQWRPIKVPAYHSKLTQVMANPQELHHCDSSPANFADFIVPDSASDGEALVSKSQKKKKIQTPKKISIANQEAGSGGFERPQPDTGQLLETINMISPREMKNDKICLESPPSDERFRSELVEALPDLKEFPAL